MEAPSLPPGAGPLSRGLARLARGGYRRPKATLTLVGFLTALSLFSARQLRVDSDLVSLLPPAFPSVQGLEQYKARGGSVGYVAAVIDGSSQEDLLYYASKVAPEITRLERVDYVEYQRPSSYFEDRLLYYLEVDELEEFAERVEDRVDWERRQANPFLVELDDTGPPEVSLSVEDGRLPPGVAVSRPGSKYYLSPDGRRLVMLIKPTELASDLAFARQVVRDVRAVLSESHPPAGVTYELAGRFPKRVEQQVVLHDDLATTSLVALLLVLLYLGVHFRSLAGVLLTLAPLVVGLVWTFGATAWLFGELNVLTTFVGAILLGLGIDHGLHLLERYSAAPLGDREASVVHAFSDTGRAVLLAAVTTAFGFLGLAVSEFRAFREFGLISALGGVLVVAAYTLCLPALLRWIPAPRSRRVQGRTWFHRYARWVLRHRTALWLSSTAVAVVVAVQIPNLSFDYDFAALDGNDNQAAALDRHIDRVLGRQQANLAILTEDEADAQAAAVRLRALERESDGRSTIDFVVTTRDLIPPDQGEKQEILHRVAEAIENFDVESLPAKEQPAFRQLERAAHAPPFGRADLPVSVRRELTLDADIPGGLVLVFPSVSLSDGQAILRLADDLQDVRLPDGRTVTGTGEAMVVADVLRLVFEETPRVSMVILTLVFLCLLVFSGSLERALLSYAPALVSVFVTLGLAAFVDFSMNYLNIVFIPVLFGMAVDSGIHLVNREASSEEEWVEALAETGRAVFGASLTTAAGFGALCLAHHPGLASLGQLALMGITVSLVASLVWLSAALVLWTGRSGSWCRRAISRT